MSFKSRLAQPTPVLAPGIYDGLTALIAEQAGFEALYLSGASIAYTRLGRSDLGLTTYSEAEMIEMLTAAGFRAQRHRPNFGHNQARMAFEARPS